MLCLPPLAWLAWNRIEEAPNADALHWGNPPVREVADAHNAWLYLLGIGAAEGDDPVAFGRRRVDAYVARARRDPMAAAANLDVAAHDAYLHAFLTPVRSEAVETPS